MIMTCVSLLGFTVFRKTSLSCGKGKSAVAVFYTGKSAAAIDD